MRIRSQLTLLVAAVLAPVVLLAAFTVEQLWRLQRESFHQQFLERVRALRLAQDTELDSVRRQMRTLSKVPDIDRNIAGFTERFGRLLANNRLWTTIGLLDLKGRPVARLDRHPLPADALPDRATRDAALAAGDSTVSQLVTAADGKSHLTYLVVPVIRNGTPQSLFYIGIESAAWLEFLSRYPIGEGATLTLNDSNGRIIARTLNNERWAGQTSSPAFWTKTVGHQDGAFINPGLEGQPFYSAFSRSAVSGWMVGTGVPQQQVEAALRLPTMLMIAGVALAAALVAFFAYFIGRRISFAMTSLAEAARATATHAPVPASPLAIDEAETVRRALAESSARLRERQESLSRALAGEQRSRAEAERASKAKDEFLAMLGHELRNPLSAMSSAATLLQLEQDPASPAAQRARDILQRQLRHLSDMVDDMLDVARLTTGKIILNRGAVDLAVATNHVLAAFRDSGRCAHLEVEVHLEPARVYADETRLEQVISNLLDNACKYTPAGRRVRLDVRADGNEALLRVQDQGSGISADLLPYVFDIFAQGERTLDRSQGGLGLGLTVVRRLIELHGGSVYAESGGTDRGAAFTVRLPLAASAAREERAAADGVLPPQRIVLVEDNPDNRNSIADVLRAKGHAVVTAADGAAGLETILAARPQVALVDVGLPGMDGLAVARAVRAAPQGKAVVLVALTGYGAEADRQQAMAAGFDAFLIKPFGLERFEAALRAAKGSELAADATVERVRPAAA